MTRFRFALTVVAGAVALTACSGPQLVASVETMIEFEATWQCDVTRFTFDSVPEIDQKREQTQTRFGVSANDHKIFTDMVEDDSELRDAVAARVDATCPSA